MGPSGNPLKPVAFTGLSARAHAHQTPVFGDWIFSVGGRDIGDGRSLSRVVVGHFTNSER